MNGRQRAGDWPTVSVVVPTRGRPDDLGRAIDAILGQRYPGVIECVVVFDQSRPDRSSEERDHRILRVMENQRSRGAPGARNTGALAATGSVLGFCDDDDQWFPDKARLQVEAMRRVDAAAAVCGHLLVYRKRRFVRHPPAQIRLSHLLRSRVGTADLSALVVNREFMLDRVGLLDEGVPGGAGEDFDFMLRLADAAPILGVQDTLLLKNWNRTSWFDEKWDTILQVIPYMLAKHAELRENPRGLARHHGRMAFGLAAQGRTSEARRWARSTIGLDWRQPRAYLALLVATGVMRASTVERFVHWLVGKRI